jgi:hypothetical protein
VAIDDALTAQQRQALMATAADKTRTVIDSWSLFRRWPIFGGHVLGGVEDQEAVARMNIGTASSPFWHGIR